MEKSFVYGIAVTDYNFTGRSAETRRLKANFEAGINSILISPRRWGKTSLVDHVCRQFVDNDILYFCVVFHILYPRCSQGLPKV